MLRNCIGILLMFSCLWFSACSGMTLQQKQQAVQTAFELIRIGMTLAEVAGLIGNPEKTYEIRAVNVQRWEYPEGILIFREGKLAEIRKAVK